MITDVVDWDNGRYEFIVTTMTPFLKQAGFNLANVSFVPCSGLSGENLVKATEPKLTSWYTGPTLIERIGILALQCHSPFYAPLPLLSLIFTRYV